MPLVRPTVPWPTDLRVRRSTGGRQVQRPTTITRFVRRAATRCRRQGGTVVEVGLSPFSHAAFFPDGSHVHAVVGDGSAPDPTPATPADVVGSGLDAVASVAGRFPAALCLDVVGRVRHPAALLSELNRLVDDDGMLYLVSTLMVTDHRPFVAQGDRQGRGLNCLLESSGFSVVDLQPVRDRGDYAIVARKDRPLSARWLTSTTGRLPVAGLPGAGRGGAIESTGASVQV